MSGAANPRGQNFDVNRNHLSLRSFATSFKKISFKSDFIQFFFIILYMYISPGQGLTTPSGWNFDVNRNILSVWSFTANFKKISLKSDLYIVFHDFIHVYSPRAGADSSQGQSLISTEMSCHFIHLLQVSKKCLVTSFICCKFQKNVFEVWF